MCVVDKQNTMLGSFGPQAEPHVVVFPRHGWEEAPSGMLARGDYKAKSQFIDDDDQNHLEYEYAFSIKKTW
jgi:Rho GDP-dissociation inhibitor